MEGINISSTPTLGPEGIWAGNSAEYVPPTDMPQLAEALNWVRQDLRRIHLAFDSVALLSKSFEQITEGVNAQTLRQSEAVQEAIKQFRAELGDQYRMLDQDIQQARNQVLETMEEQRLALDVRLAEMQAGQRTGIEEVSKATADGDFALRHDMALMFGRIEADLWPMLWASFKESIKKIFRRPKA